MFTQRIAVIALTALLATGAIADDATTWLIDLSTTGNDVQWTSPTSVDPNASSYAATLTVTLVEATVRFSIFTFTVDVTDQVPAEFLMVTAEGDGPAPLIISDTTIIAPPPPEAPAITGDLLVQLNAMGFGAASFTNVTLGTATVDIPGFGTQTVQILGVHIEGNVAVKPSFVLLGDMNCDGVVSVSDIGGFVLALTNPAEYAIQFPDCDINAGDVNDDGAISVSDIGPFVALLTGM